MQVAIVLGQVVENVVASHMNYDIVFIFFSIFVLYLFLYGKM